MSTYLQRNAYKLEDGTELSLEHSADGLRVNSFGNESGHKHSVQAYDTRNGSWHDIKDTQSFSVAQAQGIIDDQNKTFDENKFAPNTNSNADEGHSVEYLRLKAEHLAREGR